MFATASCPTAEWRGLLREAFAAKLHSKAGVSEGRGAAGPTCYMADMEEGSNPRARFDMPDDTRSTKGSLLCPLAASGLDDDGVVYECPRPLTCFSEEYGRGGWLS